MFNLIFRFAYGKECIFKLSGVLITLSALVFEIVIASSQCWRLWEFDDNNVKFVAFGLWEAYYPQQFNVSGSVIKMLVHTPINSTWTIPPEFQYAQAMIVWVVLMKPVVITLGAIAIKISCMKDPTVEMGKNCYKLCAIILCVSSLFVSVSVWWNHFVDHYGQTTLDFPCDFPVKKEALKSKYHTGVLPLGVLTAIMSFSGALCFLSEMNSLKHQSQLKSHHASILADQLV